MLLSRLLKRRMTIKSLAFFCWPFSLLITLGGTKNGRIIHAAIFKFEVSLILNEL